MTIAIEIVDLLMKKYGYFHSYLYVYPQKIVDGHRKPHLELDRRLRVLFGLGIQLMSLGRSLGKPENG